MSINHNAVSTSDRYSKMQHLIENHAAHNEETSLHLPSPRTRSTLSVVSPSNLQMIQEALDPLVSVRNTEFGITNWSGFSESVANQSPVTPSGLCQAENFAPHNCDGNSLLGLSSAVTSCSSISSENADSDSTDRHKDMAFT
jgi:hypothetical protein